MTPTDNPTNELADLYAFLSRVIADPPDEAAIERLSTEQYPTDTSPQALANGFELLRQWQSGIDDPTEAAADLELRHTALFVGPRPKMQAHESWYADDYLGEPLAAVKHSYRDLGIQPTTELREEADHAAVELATLELLAREGDDERRRAFLAAHGWWLDDLAADIQKLADDPFYEAVGWLVEGVFDLDTYLLSLNPDDLERGYDLSPDDPIEPAFDPPFEQ